MIEKIMVPLTQENINVTIQKALDHFNFLDPNNILKVTIIVRTPPNVKELDAIVTNEELLANVLPYIMQILEERPLFPKGVIIPPGVGNDNRT